MGFRIGLLPAALLPATVGYLIFHRLFAQEPFVTMTSTFLASCTTSHTTLPKGIRDALCVLEPFFKATVQDPLAVAMFFSVLLLWAPVSLWFAELGGKAGRSALLSPLTLIVVSSVGQLIGLGPAACMLLVPIYAVAKALEPQHQGLPPPASTVYTFTNFGLHQIAFGLVLGLVRVPLTEMPDAWQTIFYLFVVFPIFLTPLLFFTPQRPSPDEQPRSTNVFDVMAMVLTPAWFAMVGYSAYLFYVKKLPITPFALFCFFDSLGVSATIFGLYAIEHVSGDAKGLPNILTDTIWYGAPAAAARYFAEKEREGARRVKVLNKSK